MRQYVLVLNAGSSSLKFCVFGRPESKEWRLESRGQIEGFGTSPRISARDAEGRIIIDRKLDVEVREGRDALTSIVAWLRSMYSGGRVVGVGHRVVHGGNKYRESVRITPQVKETIQHLSSFAPLHNPANLEGIEAVERVLGNVPQVAVFDTAFHSHILQESAVYPGPYEWFEQGIRRYGFHGISHQYCAHRTA